MTQPSHNLAFAPQQQRSSSWALLNPLAQVRTLYRARPLLAQLVKRDVESRFKGSLLGGVWTFITPILMLAIYTFVFSVVFQVRWGEGVGESKMTFALVIFCGLSLFNIFAESVSRSVASVAQNASFVKHVVFPLEILPLSRVLSSLYFGAGWLTILLIGIAVFMQRLSLTAVALPLTLIPLLLLTCGCSWFVASMRVYVPDVAQIVDVLIRVLMYMSAIFFPLDRLPPKMQTVLLLNPLTAIVEVTRQVLLFNQWPQWNLLAYATGFSLLVFEAGYFWFMKTKRGFGDVL